MFLRAVICHSKGKQSIWQQRGTARKIVISEVIWHSIGDSPQGSMKAQQQRMILWVDIPHSKGDTVHRTTKGHSKGD